ncbi:MAG: hypothetical protein AAB524_02510, partial [Patescibacteria group bacterium]
YRGPKLTGKKTYRVKLVFLGVVYNVGEASRKANQMGYRLVEGQARDSLTAKFPKPDGKSPIAFGGSAWLDWHGRAYVACLYAFVDGWTPFFFGYSQGVFPGRWLVTENSG